jgi:hypothetical protein
MSPLGYKRRLPPAPFDFSLQGVDGHSTFGHIATFDKWFPLIPNLKAKYIISYIGIHDSGLKNEKKYNTMQTPDLLKRARYYILNHIAL